MPGMPQHPGAALFAAAVQLAQSVHGAAETVDRVEIVTRSGRRIVLDAPLFSPQIQQFIPTPLQESILTALEGKALRTDALAHACNVDQRQIFRHPGGIKELQEQGLVSHHRRSGYFRPDCPPTEMTD